MARALGPLIVSDLNGSFHNWIEQLFAYIPANLAGATIAAFAYDAIATPRRIAWLTPGYPGSSVDP